MYVRLPPLSRCGQAFGVRGFDKPVTGVCEGGGGGGRYTMGDGDPSFVSHALSHPMFYDLEG